jgi:transposase
MMTLAERLVPDELWGLVRPMLPRHAPHPHGGRPRTVPDRACLAGIVFMTITSTPGPLLPARELGCGSAATCWRRFAEWAEAGVFDRLHLGLLDRLGRRGFLDWSRASIDSYSLRAKRGGPRWRKSGRPGQARVQAPPSDRRIRPLAHRRCDRRQSPRQHAVRGTAGRPAFGGNPRRPAPLPASQAARRQGLRSAPLPSLPTSAWHHRTDRSAGSGVVGSARAASVAGGTVAVVAELLPTAAGALGSLLGPLLRVRGGGLLAAVLQRAAPTGLTGRRADRQPDRMLLGAPLGDDDAAL